MIRKIINMIMPVILTAMCSVPVLASGTPAVTANIPVVCEDIGGTFTIEPEGKAPAPTEKSVTVPDKNTGNFVINFEQPDNYTYVIRQTAGNKQGVTYDNSVYTVTVHVLYDENNMLKSELEVRKNGSDLKSDSIKYKNSSKTENKTTETDSSSRKTSNVKTSDPAEIGRYAAMSAGCVAVLIMAAAFKIRERIKR